MTAQEVVQKILDSAQNIAGLIGKLDAMLAAHSDAVKQIPEIEAKLAALLDEVGKARTSLASLQAEYASVKTAYDAMRDLFLANRA